MFPWLQLGILNRRLALGLFFCLPILLAAAEAQSAVPLDARQSTIAALENAWNLAVKRKDIRAIDSLLSENLMYIDYDGTEMNKAQYLASLKSPSQNFDHIVSESMTVQSHGNSAIVVGLYSEKGVKNGRPYLRHERFVDTWIQQHNIWTCVASQSTLITH